jgi:hypothetical protein
MSENNEKRERYELRWGDTSQMWGVWDLKRVGDGGGKFMGWVLEEWAAKEFVQALNASKK